MGPGIGARGLRSKPGGKEGMEAGGCRGGFEARPYTQVSAPILPLISPLRPGYAEDQCGGSEASGTGS